MFLALSRVHKCMVGSNDVNQITVMNSVAKTLLNLLNVLNNVQP